MAGATTKDMLTHGATSNIRAFDSFRRSDVVVLRNMVKRNHQYIGSYQSLTDGDGHA